MRVFVDFIGCFVSRLMFLYVVVVKFECFEILCSVLE